MLSELTTDQKGAIAESAVVHAAIKLGIGVLKPLSDGHRYDLVFDLGSQLVRVQCKWAVRRGEVVVVSCRSARRNREGFLRRPYSRDEVDLIVAFCAALDRCFVLPPHVFAGRPAVQLRLSPAKNNQWVGINWASEYEFGATLARHVLGP